MKLSLSAAGRGVWFGLRHPGNFGARVLQTAAANVALAALATLAGVVAARSLGPTGRGELAAIQLWPYFLSHIAVLGLPEAVLYLTARSRGSAGRYVSSATILGFAGAAITAGVGVVALPALLASNSEEIRQAAVLYLVHIPIFVLWAIPLGALPGTGRFTAWNALRLIQYLGWLTILIVFWLTGRSAPEAITAAYLVYFALLVALTLVWLRRSLAGPWRPALSEWAPMLRFGIPTLVSNASQLANFRVDQLILAVVVPPSTLGLYVAAVLWGQGLRPALLAVGSVLFPRLAEADSEEERIRTFVTVVRLGVTASGLAALALVLLTPVAIRILFGAAFARAVPAAMILAVGGAAFGFNGIVGGGLRGMGRPKSVMWAELIGFLVTVTGVVLLVDDFPLTGAAGASTAGYLVTSAILVFDGARATGRPARALLRPGIRLVVEAIGSIKRNAAAPASVQDVSPG